jgi:hypothetical protein
MVNVRRLGAASAAVAAVAALALVAAQVVSAAPAAKVGTSYWTIGSQQVTANPLVIKSMNVPAGKYHVTATVYFENNIPQQAAGTYIQRMSCDLFAYGQSFTSLTSVDAGGFASMSMEASIDATRSTTDVYIDVSCRTDDPTATPLPYANATIVADVMAGVVDLR